VSRGRIHAHAEETMFTTLLESRATRTRRTGSTVASMLFHGALIAGGVALTIPQIVDATPRPAERPVIYVEPAPPIDPIVSTGSTDIAKPAGPRAPTLVNVVAPPITPTDLPPVDMGPSISPEQIRIGGGNPVGASGVGPSVPFVEGSVIGVEAVERIPRVIGSAPTPRYPDALRASGITGRVTVRFVIDTTGRAELAGAQFVEATHPLFSDAVRNALGNFRFSAGEVGGRKVRTMVQLPFTFALR
jgi:periplasmic protein TonB